MEQNNFKGCMHEVKQFLRDEIKRQETNWNTDDHSHTVENILDEVNEIYEKWISNQK